MKNCGKSLLCLCALLLGFQAFAGENNISDQAIYQHLQTVANGKFKKYENITYAAPTSNQLDIIQTPAIWGLDINTYNQGFTPLHGNKIDSEFGVPTCKTNADCQGYSTCQEPDFTTDLNGNKRKLCLTPAYKLLDKIYQTIVSTKHSLDLTTLQPTNAIQSSFSTSAFTATIQHAIAQLALKSVNYPNPIQIRFLQGSFLPYTVTKNSNILLKQQQLKNLVQLQSIYLNKLTSDLPKNNKLIITLGTMRSCLLSHNCGNENKQQNLIFNFAFNHGKIIDVDNSTLITGGHNLLGEDYLQKDPVNDLSVRLQGPVVNGATIYVNSLWHYLCNHRYHNASNLIVTYQNGQISLFPKTCPATVNPNETTKQNTFSSRFSNITVMPICKLNNGVGVGDDADQSEPARVFAFSQAQHSIKISQQAVFYKGIGGTMLHPLNTVDGTVMQALASAIMRGVDVYIVTSNFYPNSSSYSPHYHLHDIYNYLLTLLKNAGIDPTTAQAQLNTYLHLGYISYANGVQVHARSHNKFWMVDDKVFYVGSHNIYPSSLQQFGVIIDSPIAANYINSTLWQPLWQNAIHFQQP